MRSSVFALTLSALFTSRAFATIYFGTQVNYKVAWISDDDPCLDRGFSNVVPITPTGQIPCDHPFTLKNGYTYVLKDCGTPSFALWNADGSYNHQAEKGDEAFWCDHVLPPIEREWVF